LRLVLVRVRAWCVLRFSGVFWVLAENGFHGRMRLKGRNFNKISEVGKMGEKWANCAKLPTP